MKWRIDYSRNADKFGVEVELLKNNKEFMRFLKELSQEKSTISLSDLEHELGL